MSGDSIYVWFITLVVLVPYIAMCWYIWYHSYSMKKLRGVILNNLYEQYGIKEESMLPSPTSIPPMPDRPKPGLLREGEQPIHLKKPIPPKPRIVKEDRKPKRKDYL